MEFKAKIAIIIPSLDPDYKLLNLLSDLKNNKFNNIVIINDGSSPEYNKYFELAVNKYGCKVIKHSVNLGKGRALKSAFNYVLTQMPDVIGAITADSDGQHTVNDIEKCSKALIENNNCLIMGCRDFSKTTCNIPFRSRFGNVMTCKILKMFYGINLSDTQTGLRGFSTDLMKKFLKSKGEGFEYEMNMIIDTKEFEIPIKEVPIKTIYIENNETSHFNPLKDSMRIYSVFSKFILSSIASFLIDIIIFTFLVNITSCIALSAYLARTVSSFFNYMINKNKVFKNKSAHTVTLIKYLTLCVLQITISAFFTKWIFDLTFINVTAIKIIVDIILFLISFRLQRGWVFKK